MPRIVDDALVSESQPNEPFGIEQLGRPDRLRHGVEITGLVNPVVTLGAGGDDPNRLGLRFPDRFAQADVPAVALLIQERHRDEEIAAKALS